MRIFLITPGAASLLGVRLLKVFCGTAMLIAPPVFAAELSPLPAVGNCSIPKFTPVTLNKPAFTGIEQLGVPVSIPVPERFIVP